MVDWTLVAWLAEVRVAAQGWPAREGQGGASLVAKAT